MLQIRRIIMHLLCYTIYEDFWTSISSENLFDLSNKKGLKATVWCHELQMAGLVKWTFCTSVSMKRKYIYYISGQKQNFNGLTLFWFLTEISSKCHFGFCLYQTVHDERLCHQTMKSANQHFASNFWMQMWQFMRRTCKLSFFPSVLYPLPLG